MLIALVDPNGVLHSVAISAIDTMAADDLQFVSAISIGEIRTGVVSVQRIHGRTPVYATKVLAEAQARSLLLINAHVAEAYGDLKAAMVSKFMPKRAGANRLRTWKTGSITPPESGWASTKMTSGFVPRGLSAICTLSPAIRILRECRKPSRA